MTTDGVWVEDVPYEEPDPNAATKRNILWLVRAVAYLGYAYVLFVEIILAFGFFFLLAGANPSSSFVEWIYRSLDRVMDPFRGIFTPVQVGTTTEGDVPSIFETSVLFAMLVYALLAIGIHAFTSWMTLRMERLQREDYEFRRRQAAEEAARRWAAAAGGATTGAAGITTNPPGVHTPPPTAQPPTSQPNPYPPA